MMTLPLGTVEALSDARIAIDENEEIVSSGYEYTLGGESAYVITSSLSDEEIS